MDNRLEGDPKLFLTQDGADLLFQSGQSVMEQGLENEILLSLFTQEGWCGNVFLEPENQIGSDYEVTCSGPITKSKLADIENSATRALMGRTFPSVEAHAVNRISDNLQVELTLGGGTYSLAREGALWRNQRERRDTDGI